MPKNPFVFSVLGTDDDVFLERPAGHRHDDADRHYRGHEQEPVGQCHGHVVRKRR